jgi:hypothetical protein
MHKVMFAGVVAIFVSAPCLAQDYSSFIASAKRALTKDFKDPDGAKYRDLAVYRELDGKDLYLCGEVNAKNSYGAFTGYVPFFSRQGHVKLKEGADDSLFDVLKSELCGKKLSSVR